jgi:hypothetical protein
MRWEAGSRRILVVVVAAMVTALVGGAAWAAADAADRSEGGSSGATVLATEGGLEGGRLWLVHDGARERIYQPQPLTADDLGELGIAVGEPAGGPLRVASRTTGSSFAVLPADGPEAALFLRVGDRLHRLTVAEVAAAEVQRLPDAATSVIDRLAPPR